MAPTSRQSPSAANGIDAGQLRRAGVLDQPVLLQTIHERYETRLETLTIGSHPYALLVVRDTNVLLDAISPEEFARDERLPYWAEIWTSAIGMAAWIHEQSWDRETTVLELGCGLGLAGIAAAAAGATVVMTDYDPDALMFARYNAQSNLPPALAEERVSFMSLDWRHPAPGMSFDVILGADVMYERRMFAPLLGVMRAALRPSGRIMLVDPDRSVGRDFLQEAMAAGYDASTAYAPVRRGGRETRVVRALLTRNQHE